MAKLLHEFTFNVKPNFQFETDTKKIFEFLKEHYQVPEGVYGFTLTADIDDVVRIEWRTILLKNGELT